MEPCSSKEEQSEPEQNANPGAIYPDMLPEYCRYKDEGCELSDSCLDCPYPQCIYDEPGGRQRWFKRLRDREIASLFRGGDRGVKELALMFGVSERTVQRALKKSIAAKTLVTVEGEPK